MKECKLCSGVKPLEDFCKCKKSKLGRGSYCKKCVATRSRAYYKKNSKLCRAKKVVHDRSFEGYLSKKYGSMRRRVSGKCHRTVSSVGQSLISRDEFLDWAIDHSDYIMLYNDWVDSGYQTRLAPSVDRIDERFGYELFNMQWVTVSENVTRANIFRHHGRII